MLFFDQDAAVTTTSTSDPENHNQSQPRWLLRQTDQTAAAGLVVAALVIMVGWWFLQSGAERHLIEIDRAKPLVARFQLDVNTADMPELMQLPSIGPKLARRIIESRDTLGPFADHDDLRRVRGIGPKTLEKLRPHLRPVN